MASGKIGNIAVLMTLNSSGFQRGLRKAQKQADGFARKLSTVTKSVGGFGVALSATAGIAGLAAIVRSTASAIDRTAKFADTVGLSTEALIGFQHAASLAGIDAKQLEKGFERLGQSIAEAVAGVGEAKEAFASLGLNAIELNALDAEEAFLRIADAMQNAGSRFEQIAAARDIFGRPGAEFLRLFDQGSAGLKAARIEAERLGMTFDRMSAARVEQMNDELTRAKGVFQSIANIVTIGIANPITETSKNVRAIAGMDVGRPDESSIGALDILEAMRSAKRKIQGYHIIAPVELGSLAAALQGFGKASRFLDQYGDNLREWTRELDGVRESTEREVRARAAHAKKVAEAAAEAERMNALFDEAEQLIRKTIPPTEAFRAEIERINVLQAEQMLMAEQYARLVEDAASRFSPVPIDAATPLDEFRAAAERLDLMLDLGTITLEQHEAAVASLTETFRAADPAWQAYAAAQERAASILESLETPAEAFARQMEELNDLWRQGVLAADEYDRIARAYREELELTSDAARDQAAALAELERAADRVRAQTRTPLERYEAELAELRELLSRGLIDAETFDRAVAAASEELRSSLERERDQLAGGLAADARISDFGVVESLRSIDFSGAAVIEPPAKDQTIQELVAEVAGLRRSLESGAVEVGVTL